MPHRDLFLQIVPRKHARELGLKRYYTGVECKNGHIAIRSIKGCCHECVNQYRSENKSRIAEVDKIYRANNRDKAADSHRRYVENNKEKTLKRKMEWHHKNPMSAFTRSTIQRLERASGAERIERYELTLGYTKDEFINHIESQFKDGMSWSNRSEWHIDHIKPISLFVSEGETDVKVINALSNLQPLWARENIIKGSTYAIK